MYAGELALESEAETEPIVVMLDAPMEKLASPVINSGSMSYTNQALNPGNLHMDTSSDSLLGYNLSKDWVKTKPI